VPEPAVLSPTASRPQLVGLGPIEQLRAGRLPRRITQLLFGLFLYGFSMGLLIRAVLGVDPWDVLHLGLTRYLPMSFGTVVIVVSIAVLLLWVPLRQKPGLGTLCNALLVGVFVDLSLAFLLPAPDSLPARIAFLVAGIVLNGLAGAIYIGAQLGPGTRDGLMTGLVRRTGRPVWQVRTALEVTVVVIGFLLGGNLGIGTLAYAVSIGPLVQFFLPRVTVRLTPADPGQPGQALAGAPDGTGDPLPDGSTD
jgi:uncharacterized membrane protein YczE